MQIQSLDYLSLASTPAERMKAFEKLAKKSPGVTFTWDAGEGWKTEATYRKDQRRVCFVSINPRGDRIV